MTLNKAHVVEEEVKRRNEKKTFSTIGLVYQNKKKQVATMIEGIEHQQYMDDNILTAEEAAKMRERSRIKFGIKQIPGETIVPLKQKKRSERNASKHLVKVPRSLVDTINWDEKRSFRST